MYDQFHKFLNIDKNMRIESILIPNDAEGWIASIDIVRIRIL